MEQRKIIFLDVDGTLVDYSGHIPQSAAEAVRLARQKGHKVYICTVICLPASAVRLWTGFTAGSWSSIWNVMRGFSAVNNLKQKQSR